MRSLTKVLGVYVVLGTYEFRTSTETSWVHVFFSRKVYTSKIYNSYNIKTKNEPTFLQTYIHLDMSISGITASQLR